MSGKFLLDTNVVIALFGGDTETAYRYGEVKDRLRQKGRPIPENDIWIAAIAFQHELTLLTSDMHFAEVENLGLRMSFGE